MSMFESARFVRFATLLAVALVLLLSGVVVGAAGGPLIMGAANSAGVTNTSLTTTSAGSALLVTQTGTGTALRGVANNGIAGFFLSANGSGVSGVVANNTKYGVYGANDAGTFGGGAAVRAFGNQNNGVIATTANASADAVRAVNTGGGTALDLVVNADVPPMAVNSNTKVVNLNTDLLDGIDSYQFELDGSLRLSSDVDGTTSGTASTQWIEWTFTQPAGRTMLGYVVDATAHVPPTCTGTGQSIYLYSTLGSDTEANGRYMSRSWTAPTANTDVSFRMGTIGEYGAFPAPATDTSHTLHIKFQDQCTDGSDWTFTSIVVDVVFAG
jgi:hypothetical protein